MTVCLTGYLLTYLTLPHPPTHAIAWFNTLCSSVFFTVTVTVTLHHDDTDLGYDDDYASGVDDVNWSTFVDSLVWDETRTFTSVFDALVWAYTTTTNRWTTWSLVCG